MDDGSYPVRPKNMHGAADLGKAIRAVGRGSGGHDAIRRHIIARAKALGLVDEIPDNWNSDGSLEGRSLSWTPGFTRTYPLDDIRIRGDADGDDGRTVEAYAAVFDTASEIRDQDGHYTESISRTAFDKTIAERAAKFQVFYNHGLTLHGTPSERGSMPLGAPLEVRADGRGLFTVTRYNRTALADEVLENIHSGAITGQSFSGRFIQSDPARVPRRGRGGELPQVTRTEIALREYGPTPFPAYQEAAVVGVRAIARQLDELDEERRAELVSLLTRTGTPDPGAVTEESPGHSGRLIIARNIIRARMHELGVHHA
ncbi:MAG: HK97 family phage prohead protease [Streptosporangiales bacterium]